MSPPKEVDDLEIHEDNKFLPQFELFYLSSFQVILHQVLTNMCLILGVPNQRETELLTNHIMKSH